MRLPILFLNVALMAHLAPSVVRGQSPFSLSLVATDGSNVDSVIIGLNSSASYGIDDALGEIELPPVPQAGLFDVRSVDLPGHNELGQGLRVDIRQLTTTTLSDTFHLMFQSSSGGEPMSFYWPEDLGRYGGGGWRFVDVVSGGAFDVDMTTQSSFSIPPGYLTTPQAFASVYVIRTFDTYAFRTFSYEYLAKDADAKGRVGKYIKRKPDKNDFAFLIVVPAQGTEGRILSLDFSMNVDAIITNEATAETLAEFSAKRVRGAFAEPLDSGTIIRIAGRGDKGRYIKAKTAWGQNRKNVVTQYVLNRPGYPYPNSVNALMEMMAIGFPTGLAIGDASRSDSAKYVSLRTYRDILKSLSYRGYILHTGEARYLNSYQNGRPIKRPLRKVPPSKHSNKLFAEVLTLNVNLGMSMTGRTPSGLADVQFLLNGSPLYGKTIGQIAAAADTFLTWGKLLELPAVTADDLYYVVKLINGAFLGSIDTVSFATETVFSGSRPVGELEWLIRQPSVPVAISRSGNTDLASLYVPEQYGLEQNYPNPFNPTSIIEFSLAEDAVVTLDVYNMLGQKVATLVDGELLDEGSNAVEFEANGLPSGVYVYRLVVRELESNSIAFSAVRKMMMLK